MDRAQVAGFYRGKGYIVHESFLATGQSGNALRIPLLCEGPLGNLAVFFGDAGGIDGPEIGAAKRIARDIGATAVVAAGQFSPTHSRAAAELGVVLLDEAAIESPVPVPVASAWPGPTPTSAMERDLAMHPWPSSGRPGGADARAVAASGVEQLLIGRDDEPVTPEQITMLSPPSMPIQGEAVARSDDAGLWKMARRGQIRPGPFAMPARSATSESLAGRFAWLGLPAVPEPSSAAEYEGQVAIRTTPLSATIRAKTRATLAVRHDWRAQMPRYTKMALVVALAGLAVYFFARWYGS